jgi:hypothetical protein
MEETDPGGLAIEASKPIPANRLIIYGENGQLQDFN